MIQSDTETDGNTGFPLSYYAAAEEDEILEDSIDTFDEAMDNDYDDGIVQSDVDDLEEDGEEDEPGGDEDNIIPFAYNDEFADYDELEE